MNPSATSVSSRGAERLQTSAAASRVADRLQGSLQASATRRALLLTALGGLLIAGLVTALPIGGGPGRLAGYIDPVPPTGAKGNDAFNRAASGNCLMWPDRMPEAATHRRLQGRAPLRGRRVHRHAHVPRFGVRPVGTAADGHPHRADQPGAVRVGRPPLPRRQVRPQQQIHHQHAVVRRQGVAAVRRATDAVRPAAARRGQPADRLQGQGRRRRPVESRGRTAPAWASTRRPTSPPTSRSTAPRRTRWRSPARSTCWPGSPRACRRSPSRTASSRTPAPS